MQNIAFVTMVTVTLQFNVDAKQPCKSRLGKLCNKDGNKG